VGCKEAPKGALRKGQGALRGDRGATRGGEGRASGERTKFDKKKTVLKKGQGPMKGRNARAVWGTGQEKRIKWGLLEEALGRVGEKRENRCPGGKKRTDGRCEGGGEGCPK